MAEVSSVNPRFSPELPWLLTPDLITHCRSLLESLLEHTKESKNRYEVGSVNQSPGKKALAVQAFRVLRTYGVFRCTHEQEIHPHPEILHSRRHVSRLGWIPNDPQLH